MSDANSAKRIPKSLGTDVKLLGRFTMSDLAVGLLPAVLVVLGTQMVVPARAAVAGVRLQSLTLPLVAIAIAIGAMFVFLTPRYTTSMAWLGTLLGYARRSKNADHEAAKAFTHLERVYPERGAVERADGAFFGMIQVQPPTMALATTDEWARKAAAFEDFLDTAVEFPIQIFSTTQPFPVEQYLATYEDRLDDEDVQANPKLEALIRNYLEWYVGELADRRMTIRDHYVVVPVRPSEVHFERESIVERVADLPILGLLVRTWRAPHSAEERMALFEALDTRLARVETGLREIDGCNARRVDAMDATRVVAEFWAGEPLEYGDIERVLRTDAIVRSQS